MILDEVLRDLVAKEAPAAAIREAAVARGMRTLGEDGLEKILLGITTPEEVLRAVYEEDRAGPPRGGMSVHIHDLLRETVEAQASDLHLTTGLKPVIRVWGRLQPLEHHDVLTPEDTQELVYSMLNAFQKQKFEKNWELDLSYGVAGLGRFRVNVYRQRGAIGAALRVIPSTIPTIEELNLPSILKDLTRK